MTDNMLPHDHAIEQVMRDTGMGRLQAINHLRGQRAALAALADRRNQQLRRLPWA